MLNIIIVNGLERFIEGTQAVPSKFLDNEGLQLNPKFTSWERSNQLVMTWIYASLTLGMMGKIVEFNTAHEIWTSLNKTYQSPSIATMMGLKSQLQKIKKEGISISKYLSKVKELFDKFAAIGEPLSHRDKLVHTLEGLTEEYDYFVTFIHNRADRPPLEEVHSLLHTFEYRLEQRNSVQQLNFAQANLTSFQNSKKFQKSPQPNYTRPPPQSFPYM
ncbi:hypothetical protein LWI28_014875 [Acer negundo]|uniref:Retrotransposon gag domain-containing protein n=1 Tax=Acer negundo TaxID=4023 RepID=A0AAD5IVJ6_ACENE|nr:hypothetical protein LWI28_014875 [Acer negundo]